MTRWFYLQIVKWLNIKNQYNLLPSKEKSYDDVNDTENIIWQNATLIHDKSYKQTKKKERGLPYL